MGHQLGECTEKHGDGDLEVMAEYISDGGEGLGGQRGLTEQGVCLPSDKTGIHLKMAYMRPEEEKEKVRQTLAQIN